MPTTDVRLVELTTTGVAAGGDALGRDAQGRVVFVEGALPDEGVRVRLTEERRDFARAVVVDVVDPAPGRVLPPCPEVERGCGGCQWQFADPETQRRMKVDIVRDALRRIAHLDAPPLVEPPADRPSVPPTGYRTTLHLAVDDEGRPAYRRRRGHELVVVESCLVAHPLLADLVTSCRFPGASDVTLRVGGRTGDRLALPVPASREPSVPPDVILARRDSRGGGSSRGRAPKGRTARSGRQSGSALFEEAAGRRWRISPSSFFQSGPDAADALVAAVSDAVGADLAAGAHLVDAYCGVGLLGGALAASRRGVTLTGIEASGAAAADARANLADLDARIVTADVGQIDAWGDPVDVIVADPARSGLGPTATQVLAGAGAPVLILVSCDPASLARDTHLLALAGYGLARVEVLDLFPHTFHLEAVSRFERVGKSPRGR